MSLTPAQQRILEAVRNAGEKTYNGRSRRPIQTLERAGLVTVNWGMRPQPSGTGIELVECITVRPRSPGDSTQVKNP